MWKMKVEKEYEKQPAADGKEIDWAQIYKEKNLGSWRHIVEKDLEARGVKQGLIISKAGDITWGRSPMFRLHKGEFEEIAHCLDRGYGQKCHTAICISGTRYLLVRCDDSTTIKLKNGTKGACIWKTQQAVIIATYEESRLTLATCTDVVGRLADWMLQNGN